ncbi:MAG: GGDEF domain-containing protein [Candidatus Omnitrophica bacterium]|nr:GGDEF domain-containing protein [Candidatus Omnitrophota bacterium]
MVSGLCWARAYTGALTAATAIAFIWTQAAQLGAWTGWAQWSVFALTPWLLAAQRERAEAELNALHAQEAAELSHLSGAARSLLSLQHATQQMESQITDINDLYRITKETVRALHLPELFSASLHIAPRFLDARALRLIDLSADAPHALRADRSGGEFAAQPESGQASEVEQAIVRRAMATQQPGSEARPPDGAAGGGAGEALSAAFPEGVSRISWAPLWREQRVAGVLVADELPEGQLKTLTIVANQLSLQLSRILLYRQVESLAVTDALTGLFVRHHFMERAREELARSKRHGLSCTLLMADLDLFKQKNDTYGHLVGDVVLKDVARLLQRNLREIDMIARYGGEEFILMLIETQVEQAMPIAQRLKQLVEVHPIRAYDELLTQTISIGVAGFPDHADTLEALIERADQALYEAKRAGRNQVVLWNENIKAA